MCLCVSNVSRVRCKETAPLGHGDGGRAGGRRVARLPARMLAAALLALALLSHAAAGDVVFHVPQVLVRHSAATRSVGSVTGAAAVRAAGDHAQPGAPGHSGAETGSGYGGYLELQYEEFFLEHEVSTREAREAATQLNLNDADPPAGCGACSAREAAYCARRLLSDHCCCERRPQPEPLRWVPHACYVGAARCRLSAPDCSAYSRLRDCCCRRPLADRWKKILSSGVQARSLVGLVMAATLLLMVG